MSETFGSPGGRDALAGPAVSRMEAAGFAPASEHTSPQESTMRIRVCGVAPRVKTRKNR